MQNNYKVTLVFQKCQSMFQVGYLYNVTILSRILSFESFLKP